VATIVFKYRKSSTTYSRTFAVSSVRGYDEPDEVEFLPPIQQVALDGTIIEEMQGFRRVITVGFGVLQEAADRAFVFNFLANNERWITMSPMGTVVLALADPTAFANQWQNGHKLERNYDVQLRETILQTAWPDYADPVEIETLYIKTDVQITGTPESPQTLTTNTAPLATDDTGQAYPAISLTTHAVSLLIAEKQDCVVYRTSDISQSGNNITFQVAHANAGNAYSDGNFYAALTIGLQEK